MGDSSMAYVFRGRVGTRPRLLEGRAEVVTPRAPLITAGERVRAELKRAIADVWALPEAQVLRDELSQASRDYAEALRALYRERGISDAIRSLAQRFRIGYRYKMVWGKEY